MAGAKFICLVVLWVFAFLVFALTVIMNVFARGADTERIGIFLTSVSNLSASADYTTEFSPSNWHQWYWCAIGGWQLVWLLYGGTMMFRKGINDEPLMSSPALISIPVYALYIFANGLNIGGLFLWDRRYEVPGLVFMALLATTLWVCLGLTCWALSSNHGNLLQNGLKVDPWLIRVFLHNGLAIYAAYCTVLFFMQLTVVIQYISHVKVIDAATICLAILDFFVVVYFLLDVTILDRWIRYVITPYISITYLLGAVIHRNWHGIWMANYRNSTFVATSLGVYCCFGVAKIVMMIVKSTIDPGKPMSASSANLLKQPHDEIAMENGKND